VQPCDNDYLCLKATILFARNNLRKTENPSTKDYVRKMEVSFIKDHPSCQENNV
jgi:hypothetical protein